MNTTESVQKDTQVNKADNMSVNDEISKLTEKKNILQNEIYEAEHKLQALHDELNECQQKIDIELLKQAHADDLIGKCILYNNTVYHVRYISRNTSSIMIESDWGYDVSKKHDFYMSTFLRTINIPFEDIDKIISGNDDKCKFVPVDIALAEIKQHMMDYARS